MNKKKKTLWILIGCFLLLVVLLVGIQTWGKKKEEKDAEKEEAEKTYLFQTEELQRIIYSDNSNSPDSLDSTASSNSSDNSDSSDNSSESDSSDNSSDSDSSGNSNVTDNLNDSNTWVFLKENGTWIYEKDETIALKQDTMTTMENAFKSIEAVQTIEEPDSLADYGLDNPKYRLSLQTADEEHSFLIGNTSGENYYIMEENGDTVYTVSGTVVSQMVWTMDELAETDSFPYVSQDSFVKMTVDMADGTQKVYDSEEEEQEDTVSTVSNTLATTYFTNFADYHATDETLSSYGLDEANRNKVSVTYKSDSDDAEQTTEFYIGSKDESGTYYYVQLKDSQQVGRILATTVETLLNGE